MIQFQSVQVRQGGRILFDDATFQIHPGWKVGLIGANGAGKSTLFAALQGQLAIDQGSLSQPQHWTVAHMAQEVHADATCALDFVCAGDQEWLTLSTALAEPEQLAAADLLRYQERFNDIDGYTTPSRAAQMLDGLGFQPTDLTRAVQDFSGGWRMRLALARTLMSRSDLLLLDEPTNHLDLDALLWLEQWLQQYTGTLLLISHDREFLDAVVDHVIHIDQQRLQLYTGNFSQFERTRAERLAQLQQSFEKQQQTRAHLQKYIDRFKASATRAKQAQSRVKQLERMQAIVPAHADSAFQMRFFTPARFTSPLIQLSQARIGYQPASPILERVDFTIADTTRIGLLGANGAGKSTLIKSLVGDLPLISGVRQVSDSLKLGYFAQQQLDNLDNAASPFLQLSRLNHQRVSDAELRAFLGGFGFGNERMDTPCQHFSGGERARLSLALIVWQRPNLLILDEPTNHLDMDIRLALSMALQEFEGAMLLVSHDRDMIRTVCDELWLVHGGCCAPFDGDLDQYIIWLAQQKRLNRQIEQGKPATDRSASAKPGNNANDKPAQSAGPDNALSREDARKLAAQRRDALRPLKKQIEQNEKQSAQLRQSLSTIEEKLADMTLYLPENKATLMAVMEDKRQQEAQLATLDDTLLELMLELETLEASLTD